MLNFTELGKMDEDKLVTYLRQMLGLKGEIVIELLREQIVINGKEIAPQYMIPMLRKKRVKKIIVSVDNKPTIIYES